VAIYDHKYGGLDYFRIYRAWGGKEYQEYVRIKKSRTSAYKKAQAIDSKLEKAYQLFLRMQATQADYHVRKDGSIRGLRRVVVNRPNRKASEVFELRINVPWDPGVKRTTISISVHGGERAFELALKKICEWYELSEDSAAARAMGACKDGYLNGDAKASMASVALLKAKHELESLTDGVFKGFKRLGF
jgi:hypothetical protein